MPNLTPKEQWRKENKPVYVTAKTHKKLKAEKPDGWKLFRFADKVVNKGLKEI